MRLKNHPSPLTFFVTS
ncbi:hypothetical protein BpHYR1_032884 [Brachionus plicatilis]|uniref:Uncharacterized protein n=1 Tax=Brachionus plicatilis TaxID=10195 RepID=A0A3M7QG16_BRAPC|nr:hypothetical protein BpHYR1_032884 [Brachionus plicatilis]